jgi:CBS domain containing-hemolysin-like protein
MRALRALFGWKPDSLRADLQVVLDATSHPDETGFSTVERTMLRNILGLRERRIADVMVPRADIVAVKRDISARRIDEPVRKRGPFAPRGL